MIKHDNKFGVEQTKLQFSFSFVCKEKILAKLNDILSFKVFSAVAVDDGERVLAVTARGDGLTINLIIFLEI
jgi:hypothetical protein